MNADDQATAAELLLAVEVDRAEATVSAMTARLATVGPGALSRSERFSRVAQITGVLDQLGALIRDQEGGV